MYIHVHFDYIFQAHRTRPGDQTIQCTQRNIPCACYNVMNRSEVVRHIANEMVGKTVTFTMYEYVDRR